MQAVLTTEFLAIVPAPIRERLMLKPGTVLDFDEETPYLKGVPAALPDTAGPAAFRDWLQASVGLAKGKLTTADRMRETRGDDLADMMTCVGMGKGKGSLQGMSATEWLAATRGPVELPPGS